MRFLYSFRSVLLISGLLSCVNSFTELSDESLQSLADPGTTFDIHNGELLAPILIPRVPGTPGSLKVLQHFVDFFNTSLPNWRLEFQNSTWTTPATANRLVPFVNLIATRDPPWTNPGEVGRLALVAHYDSLMKPEGFIGATDSAAPCAMLLHAARSIDAALTSKWADMEAQGLHESMEAEKGIQIILLDGEEAFVSWSDTDSLYGARSLAATWEATIHPALSTYHDAISSISLFVLLDLLGSTSPRIPSYFKTTHWAYKAMANLEVRLRQLKQFKSSPNHPSNSLPQPVNEPLFLPEAGKLDGDFRVPYIGDDHVPFMARGVEVLHLIPTPFPRVWHRMEDDGEHLDINTVEDWAKLVSAFAAEWLDLEGHMAAKGSSGEEKRSSTSDERLVGRSEL